jgi:hypothetical protein
MPKAMFLLKRSLLIYRNGLQTTGSETVVHSQNGIELNRLIHQYFKEIGRYVLLLFIIGTLLLAVSDHATMVSVYAWGIMACAGVHLLWMISIRTKGVMRQYDKDT